MLFNILRGRLVDITQLWKHQESEASKLLLPQLGKENIQNASLQPNRLSRREKDPPWGEVNRHGLGEEGTI